MWECFNLCLNVAVITAILQKPTTETLKYVLAVFGTVWGQILFLTCRLVLQDTYQNTQSQKDFEVIVPRSR